MSIYSAKPALPYSGTFASYTPHTQLAKSSYAVLETKPEVQKTCSVGCIAKYGQLREQRKLEKRAIEEQRKKDKQRSLAVEQHQFQSMHPEGQIHFLLNRVDEHLPRAVNLNEGYKRRIESYLTEAHQIAASDAKIADTTADRLSKTQRKFSLQDTRNIPLLESALLEALEREQVYRNLLSENSISSPFAKPQQVDVLLGEP